MDDRYEIRGKIGQGGLGAVYRAYDLRMSREVAIKRILLDTDDESVSKEGTRQLIKEAGALASLQHPNIVTIYDIGTDKDGPFVVMELLAGHDLQDLIEKGSFTWPDFRQLAMQALEALVAAQELHLVHRDLKPSNIMLTWLPSGKFQVKIVDFGLAKLSVKPSLQTIDTSDGVFGSIYFMAPEQFERVPIDLKCDLYAIGCVFYYALTGTYPFDGDHAAQVMVAHLQHFVEPLQEVREGIPVWACDWVMWLINRRPEDRPASAHEALMLFMSNDDFPNPELSLGKPLAAIEQSKRPRLAIPGSAPVPDVVEEPSTVTQSVKTASMPKPLAPPVGLKPSVHTSQQVVNTSPPQDTPEPSAPNVPANLASQPAAPALRANNPGPRPVNPAAALPANPATKPLIGRPPLQAAAPAAAAPAAAVTPTTSIQPRGATPHAPASGAPMSRLNPPSGKLVATKAASSDTETVVESAPSVAVATPKKKGLSKVVKALITTSVAIIVMILAVYYIKNAGKHAETKLFKDMINKAAFEGTTELAVDKRKLEILTRKLTEVGADKNSYAIFRALLLATAIDGTDVDARIAEFATTQKIDPIIRIGLIREVLGKRKNPAIVSNLLRFARSTEDTDAAIAAIEATTPMATSDHFEEFIEVIRSSKQDQVFKLAEKNAADIIDKASSKSSVRDSLTAKLALRDKLLVAYSSAANEAIRHAMLKLLGRVGGDKALEIAKKNLQSTENDKLAAIAALGVWGDRDGYLALISFLKSDTDSKLRPPAFDAAHKYAVERQSDITSNWTMLAGESKSQDEQMKLINGLANVKPAPWIFEILQNIAQSSTYPEAVDHAERIMIRLKGKQ